MLETRLRRTAEKFWGAAAHIQCRFPRDIESAIAWSLPLFIVRVPNLWVHDVESYLRQRQSPAVIGAADRRLHGCIIAMRGKGFIAVDGTDSPNEIRFTIAHEVAHFLLDYQEVRLRAVEKLGSGIEEVLDGQRPPRPEERVDGLLANSPIGLYTHFMHRDDAGVAGSAILEVESRADRLAFELVAPEGQVWRGLPRAVADRTYGKRVEALRRRLTRHFGLSRAAAQRYAVILCRSRFGGASVREWLGLP
jgi:hypothetical protein